MSIRDGSNGTVGGMPSSSMNLYLAVKLQLVVMSKSSGTTGTATGTGFIVYSERTQSNYLITNRHVVEPAFAGKVDKEIFEAEVSGYYQDDAYGPPTPFRFEFSTIRMVVPSRNRADIAVLSGDMRVLQGQGPTGSLVVPRAHVSLLANAHEIDHFLRPGDDLFTPGYPELGGYTSVRPLAFRGTVSSDPRTDAEFGGRGYPREIFSHSFSWGGMSGSPVYAPLDRLGESRIVGVNAGHVKIAGAADGLLGHFVRADEVLHLLAEQGDVGAADRLRDRAVADRLSSS